MSQRSWVTSEYALHMRFTKARQRTACRLPAEFEHVRYLGNLLANAKKLVYDLMIAHIDVL